MVHPYIEECNRSLAAVLAENEARKQAKKEAGAHAARERLTPLEDRLKRLLSKIPVDVQREGLSLSSLQASLRGRWRGNCHPGELGSALRKLGFKRERRWHGGAGFRALWYPPY
ncbi:MAG: hypothetical protein WCF20_09100 [Methylovirgula sp.]